MTERNGRCMVAQNRGVKIDLLVLKSGKGKGEDWKWREWEGKDGEERMGRKEVERKGGNVKGLEGRSGRKKERERE